MEPYKSSAEGQTLTGLSINHAGSLALRGSYLVIGSETFRTRWSSSEGSGLGAPALKGPGLSALALKVSN